MNSIFESYYPTFRLYQALREQLMGILTDADLEFHPGGENPALRVLCWEIGEVEQAYIESFYTFELLFANRPPDPDLTGSVTRLSTWYKALDTELEAAVGALSEGDIQSRQIDRGGGFTVPALIQLQIYNEALLIFYGKVSVYLKAAGIQPSERWQHWIG